MHKTIISNCLIKSESNCIKFGTGSKGGFKDISISNCVMFDTRLSGIALEAVEGGSIERINISNITMNDVNGAFFLRSGLRDQAAHPGTFKDVFISNVIAHHIGSWKPDTKAPYFKTALDSRIGCVISGLPDSKIENVTLNNLNFTFSGGGTTEDARLELKENVAITPNTVCSVLRHRTDFTFVM